MASTEASCRKCSVARRVRRVDLPAPGFDVWAARPDGCSSQAYGSPDSKRNSCDRPSMESEASAAQKPRGFGQLQSAKIDISAISSEALAQGVLERVFVRNPKGAHTLSNAVRDAGDALGA